MELLNITEIDLNGWFEHRAFYRNLCFVNDSSVTFEVYKERYGIHQYFKLAN